LCESLPGNRVTDIDAAFGLAAFRDDRSAEVGQQVSQPVIEQVLRSHLTRQDSAEPLFGWKVTGAALDEGPQADGALVHLEDPAGARSAIPAGADAVRPDEHIARRAGDARDIDLSLVVGRPDGESSGAPRTSHDSTCT
jgi:hypothetical protein